MAPKAKDGAKVKAKTFKAQGSRPARGTRSTSRSTERVQRSGSVRARREPRTQPLTESPVIPAALAATVMSSLLGSRLPESRESATHRSKQARLDTRLDAIESAVADLACTVGDVSRRLERMETIMFFYDADQYKHIDDKLRSVLRSHEASFPVDGGLHAQSGTEVASAHIEQPPLDSRLAVSSLDVHSASLEDCSACSSFVNEGVDTRVTGGCGICNRDVGEEHSGGGSERFAEAGRNETLEERVRPRLEVVVKSSAKEARQGNNAAHATFPHFEKRPGTAMQMMDFLTCTAVRPYRMKKYCFRRRTVCDVCHGEGFTTLHNIFGNQTCTACVGTGTQSIAR